MPDNVTDTILRKLNLLGSNSVLLDLPGNEILKCDVDLFFLGVALKLNDLHAIAQRLRNRIKHVRRGDK